uniref:THAP-type domain-containing protein n=1 Tax=Dendroctonus ponderosae TaxID=77166 RepID=A0AAR5PA71_DENPD
MPRLYYKKCAFLSCENRNGNPDVRFHMFPHGAIMFQLWMDVVNNPALPKLAHATVRRCYSVCNNHFIVSQFQTPERKKLLTKAIPKSFIAPNICMPPASDSETHPHTGLPLPVRSELLHSIGVTSRNKMTPRKRLLFHKLCSMRDCIKNLSNLLNNKTLNCLEDMSPRAQTFFTSQLRQKGHKTDNMGINEIVNRNEEKRAKVRKLSKGVVWELKKGGPKNPFRKTVF